MAAHALKQMHNITPAAGASADHPRPDGLERFLISNPPRQRIPIDRSRNGTDSPTVRK